MLHLQAHYTSDYRSQLQKNKLYQRSIGLKIYNFGFPSKIFVSSNMLLMTNTFEYVYISKSSANPTPSRHFQY